MKKDKYLFFALIFFNFLFSQEKIDENKEDKIYFTYLKKSNYIIKDSNVYGDSLMFAIDFPYLKPRKAKFSNDSLNSEFFLPVSSFINENKTKLVGILYHSNEQIEGVYDTKKNKTTLQIKLVHHIKLLDIQMVWVALLRLNAKTVLLSKDAGLNKELKFILFNNMTLLLDKLI